MSDFNIQVGATLEQGASSKLQQDLKNMKNLSIEIQSAKLADSAVSGIKRQLESAMKGITINLGNIGTQAGQNLGRQINAGISSQLSNTKVLDQFKKSLANMGMDSSSIDKVASKIANLNVQIESLGQSISTVTGKKGTSNILSVQIKGIDEFGQAVNLTQQWNKDTMQLVKTIDAVSTSSRKAAQASNSATDIQKQKLKEIEQTYSSLQKKVREMATLEGKLSLLDADKNANEIKEIESQLEKLNKEFSETFSKSFHNIESDPFLSQSVSFEKLINLANEYDSIIKRISIQSAQKLDSSVANQLKQYLSIVNQLDTKSYDSKISQLKNQLSSYVPSTTEYKQVATSLNQLEQEYKEVQAARKAYESDSSSTNLNSLISLNEKLVTTMKRTENEMKILKNEQDKLISSSTKAATEKSFATYFENNTRAATKYKERVAELKQQLQSMTTQADKLKFDTAFKELQRDIVASGDTGKSFIDELKRGFTQIGQFVGTYGLLQRGMDQVIGAFRNVGIIDDSMTQLRMATSVTNEEAIKLMNTYFQMGKQLKAVGTDVAASATEWMKQGKAIEEANKLASDSIILSKIGDLSSEDATKTITAAMKSYNLQTDEVMNFIDQISAIDMASATDVGGLATAFNEVAANAKQAGVETQQLLAYAAAIGETTQEGMASVGTSLNAIFSRMGNIKLSRLKDYESGEDLSNVELVLRKNGIALRSSIGQFRDFDEVLDETAKKWNTFNSVQQRAVAQAFAG